MPLIVEVKSRPTQKDREEVPRVICGNLIRVLMHPKAEKGIRSIEDLDEIVFEILFPGEEEPRLLGPPEKIQEETSKNLDKY